MSTKNALHDPRYHVKHKFRGWNIDPTVLQEHRLFSRYFPELTKSDHLRLALDYRKQREVAEAKVVKLIQAAEKKYGSHGSLISGGLRDYWPETVKDKIRHGWHNVVNPLADASEAHWKAAGKRSTPPWRGR